MLDTYDYSPTVAVAPDGRVGLIWDRQLWNSSGQSNYNIYWAALSSNGDLLASPANVTNNSVWGIWSDLNVPRFYDPVIAATNNGRFALAWEKQLEESTGWVTDIWYAVRDGSGNVVQLPTQLTDDTAGWNKSYYSPSLTRVSNNRVLLAFSGYVNPPGSTDIYYATLDSDGVVQQNITKLNNSGPSASGPDATQMPNGRIVMGWSKYQSGAYRTGFAVLDNNFNVVSGPTTLENPAALTGDYYVSVTSDAANRAVLTWVDYNYGYRRNLYYALVDANGAVLTPATIFQTSQATGSTIESSYLGYGNTTFTWTPPAGVDSVLAATPAVGRATVGSAATPITVQLEGRGGSPATSVQLVATLHPQLSYVSDTSGVAPTVSGQTLTWNLPTLRLYDIRQFHLNLQATSGALSNLLPVQLQVISAETDLTPGNNTATVQMKISRAFYLPLLIR